MKPIGALLMAALFIAAIATAAQAIDEKEKSLAMAATGMLVLTLQCTGYVPLPEVLKFVGDRSVGPARNDEIMKAVGAEFTRIMAKGGIPSSIDNSSALRPDISPVVDQILQLRTDEDTCRALGDMVVKHGFARKANPN